MTTELRQLEQTILATGKVDSAELELLRQKIYTNGRVHQAQADFLVELHKRVQHITPAFERFFYLAIKSHILTDGRIDAEKSAWLRRMLFADGEIDDRERKFLHELKGEAKQAGPEFEALFKDCMKAPQKQNTCR